jgi:hypothetical protein
VPLNAIASGIGRVIALARLLGLFVLAGLMMMGRLMVTMRSGAMVSRCLMVMLTRPGCSIDCVNAQLGGG